MKRQPILLVVISLFAAALTSCMVERIPSRASLCRFDLANSNWKDRQTYIQHAENGQKYTYSVDIQESRGSYRAKVSGDYQIILSGFTLGRAAGYPIKPMLYDISDAYVEVGGKRVYASSISAHGQPIASVPIDLNEATKNIGRVVIRFPMTRPNVDQAWIVHMGAIQLGDEKVQLPEYHSCYYPAHWEKRRMLPQC